MGKSVEDRLWEMINTRAENYAETEPLIKEAALEIRRLWLVIANLIAALDLLLREKGNEDGQDS